MRRLSSFCLFEISVYSALCFLLNGAPGCLEKGLVEAWRYSSLLLIHP